MRSRTSFQVLSQCASSTDQHVTVNATSELAWVVSSNLVVTSDPILVRLRGRLPSVTSSSWQIKAHRV
eukprot:1335715-Amphidinium_carterae.1